MWDHEGMYKALDGHQRIKALCSLREEGWDIPLLPVAFIEASDEADARKKLLAISSQYGEFDSAELAGWLSEMDEGIADTLRIVDGEIDIILKDPEETEGDDELPEEVEPITALGDLWQLGKHRLLCGDSTDSKNVDMLMDGKKADMVFTDPPYGISIVDKKTKKVGAENLAKNRIYSEVIGDDTTITAKEFYNTCVSLGMDKFIIWGGNYFIDFLPFSKSWIIWDKRGDMNSNNFADGEMAWCSFDSRIRIYKQIWNGMIREGEHGIRMHPTQKPVKMLSEIIKDHVKGVLIFDGFLGSGSTLIASECLNRICYGMELDPHYCDVIVGRYARWCKENGRESNITRNGEPIKVEDFFR